MKVVEVTTPALVKEFLEIHRTIYKGDPYFCSYLDQDVEKVFDKSQNKVFRHGEVIRWILQDAKGTTIGRIAAFTNKKHKAKQPTGGVGFFECIDDKEAAFLLFDTSKQWLLDRGMEAMDGPINFGEKDKFWGLIIENFEFSPYYGQNYNPEYYVKFFEDYGFEIHYKQLIFYRKIEEPLQEKFADRANRIADNPRYEITNIKKKNLEKFAEDFRVVYNNAWANRDGSGFATMSKVQAQAIMKSMKPIIDEDLSHYAYYDGKPVGFYISLPEVNQVFKYLNGNLNWFGKLRFMWMLKVQKKCKRCIGIAFGIDPAHQGKGLEGALFANLRDHIQPTMKYDDLVITWIGDFNPKMVTIIESLGTNLLRTMATYRYMFDRTKKVKRRPAVGMGRKSEDSNDDEA